MLRICQTVCVCVRVHSGAQPAHLATFSRPVPFFWLRKLCACDVISNTVVACKQRHVVRTKAAHVVHSPINIKLGQGLFLAECRTADYFGVDD